jgi:hypothetical protein
MMYKDTDITAALIMDKFPSVAAQISAEAQGSNATALTVESLAQSHPEIVASFREEGRTEAQASVDEAVSADRNRVLTIQAMSTPGYESIIEAAVADSNVTPDQVKVQLFDAMHEKRSTAQDLHKKDGETLGTTLAELSGGSEEGGDTEVSEEEKAAASMEAAGKKSRGES